MLTVSLTYTKQKFSFLSSQSEISSVFYCAYHIYRFSAGVGRTGTYILIETMIKQIKDKGTVNIPAFLLHIRKQRNFLVQTEVNFICFYENSLFMSSQGPVWSAGNYPFPLSRTIFCIVLVFEYWEYRYFILWLPKGTCMPSFLTV